ncbi:hypothetical protein BMT54_06320 [Pasteurellaceae bacterium 15-036681]|nr:hypothetical protein BMT54_06320 [Pasteurellaceae bacterium 15-036681]
MNIFKYYAISFLSGVICAFFVALCLNGCQADTIPTTNAQTPELPVVQNFEQVAPPNPCYYGLQWELSEEAKQRQKTCGMEIN